MGLPERERKLREMEEQKSREPPRWKIRLGRRRRQVLTIQPAQTRRPGWSRLWMKQPQKRRARKSQEQASGQE